MVGGIKFGMSPGFTIIEISIVLAIISALILIAFLGQGELRSNAQFNDAVDRTVAELSDKRNNANTTVNSGEEDPGTDTTKVFYGILAEFVEDSSAVKFTYFWTDGDSCPPTGIRPEQISEFEIPWEVKPINYNQAVLFGRKCSDGRPETKIPSPDSLTGELRDLNTYEASSEDRAIIQLSDGSGHCANINVEAGSGNLSKEFVPC